MPRASVEVLETFEHPLHCVADAVVIIDVILPRRLAVGERRLRHARPESRTRTAGAETQALSSRGDVHHRHRILDGYPLLAACLAVFVGAPEAGQDQRALAVHDVAAVELRAHLDGQLAVSQRLGGVGKVGRAKREVAAERDEDLHVAAVHRLDRRDRAESRLARWVDPADLAEAVEKRRVGTVIDAAGSVALHVAVPADRARSRSLASDVAPQEQQVDDLAHRIDAVLVLRDAEAPGDDHALRRHVGVGELPDVGLGNAGALD